MDRLTLIQITGIVSMAVCFASALGLGLHCRRNRARKLLAFTLFMWGIAYLFRLLSFGESGVTQFGVMTVATLVVGHFYVILTMLYPIEISRPGWLGWRNSLKLLLPFAAVTILYFVGTALSGKPVRMLHSAEEILMYFPEFNVWFRFVLYLSMLAYIAYTLTIIYLDEPRNRQWLYERYAATEKMDARWINLYGIGFSAITLSFLLVLLNGAPWNSLLHTLLVQAFIVVVVWKALRQKNPYPEGYFGSSSPAKNPAYPLEEMAHSQLFHHKIVIDNWLHREKPYLDPSFHIADIMRIVPLDTDQLARLFNLSYGEPFGTVVRKLRVEHSLQLLADPRMPVGEVAHKSGFTDATAFRRSFDQYQGMTPEAYRSSYHKMHQ